MGVKTIAYPARLGLRIAHLSRINNADAHANEYTNENTVYTKHERRTLSYRAIDSEVAKFKRAADKTLVQRLSNMSVIHQVNNLANMSAILFGEDDKAKVRIFYE